MAAVVGSLRRRSTWRLAMAAASLVACLALIMNNKPDFYVWGIPRNLNTSHAAADLCLRSEAKLQSLPRKLSRKDIKLSRAITEHAKRIFQSGDESFLAGPGFVCVMKEAELMYQLLQLQCKFDPTNFIIFSNQIRRSALNLMLHNVDKSTAIPAAAAMVGLAREAKFARYVLAREDSKNYMDYDVCDMIREGTAEVLTMLEKEFARHTATNVGVLLGAPTARKSEEEPEGHLPRMRSLQGLLCSHQSRLSNHHIDEVWRKDGYCSFFWPAEFSSLVMCVQIV